VPQALTIPATFWRLETFFVCREVSSCKCQVPGSSRSRIVKTSHLLLTDYPARYPAERASGNTEKTSVCFWYSHVLDGGSTCSTVVILRDAGLNCAGLFRLIETAADLLAKQLANSYRPPTHVMRRAADNGVL
jgi:hypothetical protein